MASVFVRGGKQLAGEVNISGSKNAVLPMIAASTLFRRPCKISGCPDLTDVDAALEILTYLGARWCRWGEELFIDPRPVCRWEIPAALMGKMRGSVFFTGPLLARFGVTRLTQPGGCPLGERPVDFHVRGFLVLGAREPEPGVFRGTLRGSRIRLPYPSVGATENLLMAALGAEGQTWIENAAREPEIVCLCDFLRSGGCRIRGDGTETITVHGGLPEAGGGEVIPDRMEAATYACALACAGGEGLLRRCRPEHLTAVLQVLSRTGCEIDVLPDAIGLRAGALHSPGNIVTGPYPAFPTDAQAPVMAALLRAEGETLFHETVFAGRTGHIGGLRAMGADIACRDDCAAVTGVRALHPAVSAATDLRCAAALVCAALGADGTSEIKHAHHLLRGYEAPDRKLRALGADVFIG